MTSIVIFALSGVVIVLLPVVKMLEKKRSKRFLVFILISKSDTYIREFYHKILNLYSEGKEKVAFFLKQRVPRHSKNSFNKLLSFLKEKREQYANNMRNAKFLKKSDGMSEFLKNMSNIEKGNGEINDVYKDASPNDRSVGRGSQNSEEDVK